MKKIILVAALSILSFPAFAVPLRIVALGDSLTAGYGLQGGESYADQLQAALQKEDHDVIVNNAGISGDTTASGLARLPAALQGEPKPSLVIVALGANDFLRGIPPATTEQNLRIILQTLKTQNIPTILYGMHVPYRLAVLYGTGYDGIYKKLAKEFDVEFYPDFLAGVAGDPQLNLGDGVHPNKQGVAIMVQRTMSLVEDSLP